jgi:hypothetical protein
LRVSKFYRLNLFYYHMRKNMQMFKNNYVIHTDA